MRKRIIIIGVIFGLCYLTFAYFFFEGFGPIKKYEVKNTSYENLEQKISQCVKQNDYKYTKWKYL